MNVRLDSNFNPQTTRKKSSKRLKFGNSVATVITSYEKSKISKSKIKGMMNSNQKFFHFLEDKKGEIQTTLVNAVGTAVVAPLFIAFNPIDKKTDKETKTYSAWRQPLSAVLAVITSVGVNIPFQQNLNNRASKGDLGEFYDLSIKPNAKYLLKKERKDNGRKLKGKEAKDFVKQVRDNLFVEANCKKIMENKLPAPLQKAAIQYAKNNEDAARKHIETAVKAGQITKRATEPVIKLAKKIAKDTQRQVKKHIKEMEGNTTGMKTVYGLALSLLVLPPTCGLLNWTYPRFMELAFPKMCRAMKMKEKGEG